MLNFVGILLALLIAETARGQGTFVGWQSPAAALTAAAGLTAFLYMVAVQVTGRIATLRLQASAALADGSQEVRPVAARAARELESIARRMPLMRMMADGLILTLFAVLTHTFGWLDYLRLVWGIPERLDLLPGLLPYLLLLAGSWLAQARLENTLHGPSWRAAAYIGFQLRANLMTLAPVLLINAAYWAVLRFVPAAGQLRDAFAFSEFLLLLVLVLPVFLFMPLVLRLILPTRPLPDGPLRRSLVDFAQRRGLHPGGLYVWETGSRHFATAFVIGLVPGLRSVFFTDALLRRFSNAEILAVFAHEMGHVRHRHLWWLLGFIVSLSLIMLAMQMNAPLLSADGAIVAVGAALVLYGYAVFGFVSRRFERQADDYAARETSPELIAGVLLKLGASSPGAMNRKGWRHFSIRRRVAEIALQSQQPLARKVFDRERRRGLMLVAAATIAALALLAQPVHEDVVSGLATFSLAQLDHARRSSVPAERLDAMRLRTLERTRAMRELNDEYARAALQYEGVIEALAGRESDALQQLAQQARQEESQAETEEDRRYWRIWVDTAEASEEAVKRALSKQTPWDEEFRIELEKRGYRVR